MNSWEIHPALIHFPVAFLLAGVVLDLYARIRRRESVARVAVGLILAGVATGWVAALAGIVAWFTAPHDDSAHPLMFWHPGVAAVSMLAFTALAVARWRGRTMLASPLLEGVGVVAALILMAAAYLGGHLVYRDAAGVIGPTGGSNHSAPHAPEVGATGHPKD